MSNLKFEEHVKHLTTHIRSKYELEIRGSELYNDSIKLSFGNSDPRDNWVTVCISLTDPTAFHEHSKSKTFFLKQYMEYLGVELDQYFPYRHSDQNAYYQTSGYQVFGFVNFLTIHGDLLLRADKEAMSEYGRYFHKQCVEYTKRVGRKSS